MSFCTINYQSLFGVKMNIGYCRVSTSDQNLEMQEDALKNADCKDIYSDVASGAKTDRPGLDTAMSHLRKGDALKPP